MKTADSNILPEGYDPSNAGRFARKAADVLEMIQMGADEWALFRRGPSKEKLASFFSALAIAVHDFGEPTIGIAAMMGLDLMPFRMATEIFENAQEAAASGKLSSDITGGTAGRVTLALRDARMAARQMVLDGKRLRGPDKSIEYKAFCAAAATVFNALALVAKYFRLNLRVVLRAANALTAHAEALSLEALSTAPQPEAMVMASWVRRACLECRRDPAQAMAMIEGLDKALQGS